MSHVVGLCSLIKREEGLSLKPYKCTAGRTTIGYGRNLDDRGISIEEAGVLLANDLANVMTTAQDILGLTFTHLDDVRRAVVCSMIYQMGALGFRQFVATIAAIQAGEWDTAADHMLNSAWAQQTPARAQRHAQMMRTGQWPEEW